MSRNAMRGDLSGARCPVNRIRNAPSRPPIARIRAAVACAAKFDVLFSFLLGESRYKAAMTETFLIIGGTQHHGRRSADRLRLRGARAARRDRAHAGARARARAIEAARHDIHVGELEERMAELARIQADTAGRVHTMGEVLSGRQSELARAVSERLDAVTHRIGQSMQAQTQNTMENLAKLNERLAVIDGAQKNITDLASQVTSLREVLANKQARGAFGQGRMEAIVQDGLPKDSLRIPVHAVERQAAGLRGVPADRRPAADHRRQVSARGDQRVARRAHRRAAQARGARACART